MSKMYELATPLLAFAAFFAGFYALLLSASRADWWVVAPLAAATIGAAVAAFVFRKTRPNLALALPAVLGVLLFAVIALR
ncbi:MAG: hypothetical protein ABL871_01630 [Terricaulis sp.]